MATSWPWPTSALGRPSMTSARPPVLENGKPSEAINRIRKLGLILRYPVMVWMSWRNFLSARVFYQSAIKTHPYDLERPGKGAGDTARELPGRSVRSIASAVAAGVPGLLCGAASVVGVLVDAVKVLM